MALTQEQGKTKKSKLPLYISLTIVLAVLLIYFFVPEVSEELKNAWEVLTSQDEERTKEWVSQFSFWGPLVIVFAMVAQMFLIIVPTPFLMVATILAYGPYWGSLIILVAIFCASTVGYAIGAYLGTGVVKKILGGKSERKIENFINEYGFWAVVVTRLSPFLSNDAISFVGGILRMGYWRFIGATLIGIAPLTILIAYLGENNQRLQNGLIWGSIASILLFLAYVWWDKKK
ncbi:TVP38/TMEM64 family protein [Marivirga sp. S37H4]|uniref:TVP38/TMEM64 family membrane protein n=1 Tax=Marivirga aurantiaca TaxID=2802615 RepID=A0A935C9H8_9BACT|nr:TVP38/TMEM64 family protein [Marivirga aurantiaca]MBK6264268.1 TVP38/TMEM64 family protein [Marivirga aurantiaca]